MCLLHLFHPVYAYVQNRAGYSKDINMKTMTIHFRVRTGHDWSKSSMLQRLCARPPCQEQVAEESTIWHKCFECDLNEHNWFPTTWYPYSLWGPLSHIEALRHKSAHRDVSTMLINEIHHLYEMVLCLLKISYRCCPIIVNIWRKNFTDKEFKTAFDFCIKLICMILHANIWLSVHTQWENHQNPSEKIQHFLNIPKKIQHSMDRGIYLITY